jgi:SAM-dependent methyltransferase
MPFQYPWWDPFAYIRSALKHSITAKITGLQLGKNSSVLDYGCGDRPYRQLLPLECHYQGADLPGNAKADINIDPNGKVPIADGSCDFVLSTQVLEHVTDPATYLDECRRVLKPGGKLLLTTHGLMFYHPHPLDLWRWTAKGLKMTVERAGLRVAEVEGVMGLTPTAIWLVMFFAQARLPWGFRHLFVVLSNLFILLSDRFTSNASRLENACVYTLIAERSPD